MAPSAPKGENTVVRIVRYLKTAKIAVALILVLLAVQTYGELALPSYMSHIVDTGIQQGGIETPVPEKIREASLNDLALFMQEADEAYVKSVYTLDSGVYSLNSGEADMDKLAAIFTSPMAALYNISGAAGTGMPSSSGGSAMDLRVVLPLLRSGVIKRDAILGKMDTFLSAMGGTTGSLVKQAATGYLLSEYKALGMDVAGMQNRYLLTIGAKMLGFSLFIMAAAIIVSLLTSLTAARIGRKLRDQLFHKVVSFSSAEMDKFSTASLITRSTNDIQQVQMASMMFARIVLYAPMLGIGGIIRVAGTNTGMGWIIAVAVGIIMLLVTVLITVAMPKFKAMQALVDRLNLVSREILTGLPVIRAFSREKHEEKRFDAANQDLMKTQLFTNRVMTFMMPIMMFIMSAVTLAIVWFGAKGVDAGNLQVGDMMAFITYTMQIIMAFMMLTMISIMLPRANVASARIDEVLSSETLIRDADTVRDDTLPAGGAEVAFNHVSFRYPGAQQDALGDISFTAKSGQTTAVIGGTGSGKTTLVHLIPRFYDVTDGSITINGIDIRSLSQKKLRSMIGFVPQKSVLFSGTVESNLKFGGESITDEGMEEAAKVAQADGFIAQMQDGYQSAIAQGGSNVSGGQKQRLSIARAIAKKPPVFIFDDSFSALDYKTDIALRRALKASTGGATVIVVAQRVSNVLYADNIVVLEEGRVAGMGTHAELMDSCPAYREIALSQLSEQELGKKGSARHE
jgi:ATP-binding cassette, subfamily B, multidrug efflux pump